MRRAAKPPAASRPWPASSTTPFRASTRGCRRSPTPRRPGRPRCRTSSARPIWSSAPQPRSIAPHRRSARPRSISRSPKSPHARTNSTVRRRGRCRRAMPAAGRRAEPHPASAIRQPTQAAPAGPDFSSLERHLLKITSQIEALQRPDHVEQSIAAFRGELAEIRHAITEAMPRRAIEFDRERNPLAVPPHRRDPPARQRRPGAGRHRARARRNPRGAALADTGRTARRLRRCDPQSRRQARPDPAHERRSLDRAAARKRDRGAARHRLQRRLQRCAGAARRRRAHAVGQGRPASRAPTATAMPSPCSSSASPR